MKNNLLLLSGNDIPFPQARLVIHQPTVKEISFMGETDFYKTCEIVIFSKDNLKKEDKIALEHSTNFEIFMAIINDQRTPKLDKINIQLLFNLLFPKYIINFNKESIDFTDAEDDSFKTKIDSSNFDFFQEYIKQIFCLDRGGKNKENSFNPGNDKAREIAEKIKRGREVAAKSKGQHSDNINILNRYISILAVGLHKDINNLMNYTIYQLYDEFERFELYISYDINFKARLAGATDLDDVEDWMKDIHIL